MIKKIRGRLTGMFLIIMLATLIIGYTPVHAETLKATTSTYSTALNLNTSNQTLNPSWGLGYYQTEYVSNNRPYDWYIDQKNTGTYANNNCGPSSVTMALKWKNGYFNKTAEDARNTYPRNGGWWSTDDIAKYLDLYGAKYQIQPISQNNLKSILKQGNIAILCINTSYIPYNGNTNQRVGRFYNFGGGHFIVVKGYRVVDGKTYFETYDPNSWNESYQDGQLKGKDRYYQSDYLMNAARRWWSYSIVIQP
ncbi:C39 family peptidase [Anaerosacchariphilus polymeriproducens]|nr:C39 family peptidase [Anaerosacchariphilus polymeriproducens]